MTEGNILRKICIFAIPCIFTRVFQNLYNLVDSAMVGQAVGTLSLAAVGATGAIVSLFNETLIGLMMGFSAVAGKKYGGKDIAGLKKVFFNSLGITMILSVIISLLGAVFSRGILELMQTPGEIIAESEKYLFIVFLGMWSMAFYNFLSEMLRAVGNSLMPLIFLICAFIAHTLLNVLILFVFNCGVVGAAISTVLSQIISVIFCIWYINKRVPFFKLKKSDFNIDKSIIKECLQIGIPMAISNFVVMFGVMILGFVTNKMGTEYVAGYSCASKIGYIITAPLFGFASAASVFVAQNLGAGKIKRINEGVVKTIIFTTVVNVILFVFTRIIERPLLEYMITDGEKGIEAGILYLKIRTVAMFWLTIAAVFKSVITSLGRPLFPTLSGVLEIVVRYVIPIVLTSSLGFIAVPMTDAVTWLMLAAFLTPAYIYEYRKKTKHICITDKSRLLR